MKNTKYILSMLIGSTLLIGNTGCTNFLDDIHPRHAIAQSQLTEDDMDKVLTGVYATMENYIYSYWWNDDLQGENFKAGPGGSAISDPCEMAPSYTNQTINILSFWRSSFTTLHQVNFLLDTYAESSNKESAFMKKMAGTAYYFRALIYYRLASHYGNVPILRKQTKDVVPISKEAEVWKFVEEDLQNAINLLPATDSKWMVSVNVAKALAARVALFQNKMTEAANYADDIIKNGGYALTETSLDFSKNWVAESPSKEIIFGFVNNSRPSSPLNFTLYVNDTDGSWNYSASDWCFNHLYENDTRIGRTGDIRALATFTSRDPNRIIKFPNGTYQLAETSDYTCTPVVVSRLSEMYLIKAEALGKEEGAATLIEYMKKRYASVPLENVIKNLSTSDFQTLILDERRREFFAEGMRWQDIKRTNRLDLLETIGNRSYLMYYPIPQAEIDMAGKDAYPQNKGYAGYVEK